MLQTLLGRKKYEDVMSDEHLLRLSEYKNGRANVNTASIIRDNIPILIMHPIGKRFALRKDNLEKKPSLNTALSF